LQTIGCIKAFLGFPVVPTTRRAVLDLDGVVLGHQPEFLEQRQIAAAEVSEVVT
jgi:hypothetical protein